jgi:3D-(3,5/4)-trihydroxycyclohexane-1,2-dione acylhydrolase (decyclizing)
VVISVGSRLQDFTTGSWTVFANPDVRFVGINAAGFDAIKHLSHPVVGDAQVSLVELSALLDDWAAAPDWSAQAGLEAAGYHQYINSIASPSALGPNGLITYAQVVGAVDRAQQPGDYVLTAAGGFPGELNNGWRARELDSFDCEYGFSCMGYEISGAWGAKVARPDGEVIAFVGDGSYMMMNSDLYGSVLAGHKMIVVVCDNGGYAVINRLQVNQGGVGFNNMLAHTRHRELVRVDFAAHAAAMGCIAEHVGSIAEFEAALVRARANDRTTVITLATDPDGWTGGGAFWEVGVPEVSDRAEVVAAKQAMIDGKKAQRIGV